ncbi:PIG-L deacetylase family protein [Limimaricola litoreus]|uniref:PIG-L family deacetylase n=1 Tax=Limimaricola litoreus TaxID=2955316 RepID=A0A9X2FTP1_9RHOB|nr:PIG-L family deacetylase [Limimaricola litoreus]MCP1166983.1 PIG-L family deacetylase [Limimaricola litoreus]
MIFRRREAPAPLTDGAFLRATNEALSTTVARVMGGAPRLAVVTARAGDETLCCGALIHAAARGGARVDVICLTQEEETVPARREETADALACLAPDAALHWIGAPADALPARGRQFDMLARRLQPLIAPDAVVLLPWHGEPQADLARGHALGRAAMPEDQPALCYLAEARFAPEAKVPHGLQLLIAPPVSVAAKRRAMGRHFGRREEMAASGGAQASALEHFLQHPELYLPR